MMKKTKPSLLQRAVNWAWHAMRGQRGFEAARRDRFGHSWMSRASNKSADEELKSDLASLVERSREQAMNNGYAKRFYQLLKNNVIGPRGMAFQSRVVLKNGKPDKRMNDAIEANFKAWMKKGNCDVTGTYHFVTFCHLWIETLARDGEVMVREVKGFPHNEWRYALQILECDRLNIQYNAILPNGHEIRMGVEIDEWERPVAYHLLTNHPGENTYNYAGQHYQVIPASEIIHTFLPWRPHQRRGIPWMHASMVELHHIGEYRRSEMIAAEYGAKKLGFYEQDPEAYDEPPSDDDGVIPENLESGTLELLPWGVRFKEFKTDHPNSNFGAFIKSCLRGVAAGSGPSYNRLSHDLEGVSFSSLRSGELDERDYYKLLQFFVKTDLLERVATSLLQMSLLAKKVSGRMADFERLNVFNFQPRGWDWVDPAKDAKANTESINNRTRTRSSIIRASGEDPEDVFEELAWEEQLLRSKGVNPEPPEKGNNNGNEENKSGAGDRDEDD